ncbi:MAG: RluA family pseudouridine synthase [Burkholderiaceae bacterium]
MNPAESSSGEVAKTPESADLIQVAATDGVGQRLDRYLAGKLADVSRSRLQKWIALGAVSCEQRALNSKTRLRGHEVLVIEPQPLAADSAFVAEPVEFEVVAQTDAYRVINKRSGLVVHPGAGNWDGTLMNGLLYRFPDLANLPRAGIVHRLDKDTSGLLVVATTESAREQLIAQLADRSLSRRYLAICAGHLAAEQTCDGAIGRDASNRLRMTVRADGKPALTMVRPLAHGQLNEAPVTLVHCQLKTGRTHQIRVHLSHAGYPLIGDRTYGGPAASEGGSVGDSGAGQMLHAWCLSLSRAVDGQIGSYTAMPPAAFLSVAQRAGLASALPGLAGKHDE